MEARELEKCMDAFGTDVYRFCRKLCVNQETAEDLYQQTFLKALEKDWSLHWEQNPKALFFSLAHNLWKSDTRKNARRAAIAPCSNLEEEDDNLLRSTENIEEQILQKELLAQTHQAIAGLPEALRLPLTLYYLFDFPVEQIASTLHKPPGTIKSRLFQGRNLIKERLEKLGYGKQASR